ncbi:CDP-alcohol phosphatidyltransferase family protein [Halocola ammonii]
MQIKKHIPNLITLSNLLCGAAAAIFILQEKDLATASLLVLLGAAFDFADGAVARILKVSGELGKQLDSLADVITFGLVPALMAYHLCLESIGELDARLAFIPLVMAAFSGFRLGKFNIDTRQSDSFIGLPTPANALLWVSLSMIYAAEVQLPAALKNFIFSPATLVVLSIVMSILLVAELPLFAMKFKSLKWRENQIRIIFVAVSLVLLILAFVIIGNLFTAIPIILFLYLILSLINNSFKNTNP